MGCGRRPREQRSPARSHTRSRRRRPGHTGWRGPLRVPLRARPRGRMSPRSPWRSPPWRWAASRPGPPARGPPAGRCRCLSSPRERRPGFPGALRPRRGQRRGSATTRGQDGGWL
ncbi:hypothetical protein D7Y13_13580 [Corallococcus praedator]|uniref:Uncharacterized protein n=1 Tax=Corallococcus praedator TaxID=2316724 RepID=A0ABX9QK10_9BACT|nr:hypothetical protein D7X74_16935 [Corallococcus sp. CA047B]RKH30242.1 hypothetical protein D7X75_21475 [Corallococcus sp. CA031C]RKI09884.1 hypothetical protein D7Y13_13580 [Corallococcus praedator]